jgi:hypothetical protein
MSDTERIEKLEKLIKETASQVSALADQVIKLAEVVQNMLKREARL